MAFTNRLELITPSVGTSLQKDSVYLSAGNALTGSTTVTMSGLSPTVRCGKIRAKIYNGGGTSPTLTSLGISFTDGTTTETIALFAPETANAPSLSSVAWIDFVFQYVLEISATSCSIAITLGGTSPTAVGDFQICPTTGNA